MGKMYEEVGKRFLSLIRKDRGFYAEVRKETDYPEVEKTNPNYKKWIDAAEIETLTETLEAIQEELEEELEDEY